MTEIGARPRNHGANNREWALRHAPPFRRKGNGGVQHALPSTHGETRLRGDLRPEPTSTADDLSGGTYGEFDTAGTSTADDDPFGGPYGEIEM